MSSFTAANRTLEFAAKLRMQGHERATVEEPAKQTKPRAPRKRKQDQRDATSASIDETFKPVKVARTRKPKINATAPSVLPAAEPHPDDHQSSTKIDPVSAAHALSIPAKLDAFRYKEPECETGKGLTSEATVPFKTNDHEAGLAATPESTIPLPASQLAEDIKTESFDGDNLLDDYDPSLFMKCDASPQVKAEQPSSEDAAISNLDTISTVSFSPKEELLGQDDNDQDGEFIADEDLLELDDLVGSDDLASLEDIPDASRTDYAAEQDHTIIRAELEFDNRLEASEEVLGLSDPMELDDLLGLDDLSDLEELQGADCVESSPGPHVATDDPGPNFESSSDDARGKSRPTTSRSTSFAPVDSKDFFDSDDRVGDINADVDDELLPDDVLLEFMEGEVNVSSESLYSDEDSKEDADLPHSTIPDDALSLAPFAADDLSTMTANPYRQSLMTPIVRGPFPDCVPDRSPIDGLDSSAVLRTCFRLGEAFNSGCHALRTNKNVLIELYARVVASHREEKPQDANSNQSNLAWKGRQRFVMHDLFHDHPPYINAVYQDWKGFALFEDDCAPFLWEKEGGRLCRCFGEMKREEGKWIFDLGSIWEAGWEDVEFVREIVCA